jgi:hypothetical protein
LISFLFCTYARGAASLGGVGVVALRETDDKRQTVDKGQPVQP